jgi:hypothetical protein
MKAVWAWILVLLASLPIHAVSSTGDDQHLIVEALRCRGNVNTSCRFILGSVYLMPGDRLNEDKIQDAKLRLSGSRNFKSVDIHLEKGSERGKVVVIVEVSEANPISHAVATATERLGGSWTQLVTSRVTDYNSFGAGKIIDAQVSARMPISGPELENVLARLQYVDPHLFDSQRYFMSAGVSSQHSHFEFDNGDSYEASNTGADLSFGRRLLSFSYVTVGYQYRPVADVVCHVMLSNGSVQTSTFNRRGTFLVSAGRNTLDDPDFPTQGSLAQLYFSGPPDCSDHLSFGYDEIRRLGAEGFLELRAQAGDSGIRYSHVLEPSGLFRGIRRGRWYLEPGLRNVEYGIAQRGGGAVRQFAVRAGLRIESETLGIVDLSVYVTTDRRTGAGP